MTLVVVVVILNVFVPVGAALIAHKVFGVTVYF